MASIGNEVSAARDATLRFGEARNREPHPLFGTRDEVVPHIRGLQAADRDLAAALTDALSQAERSLIERRRQSADAAVARQMGLVARRMSKARQGSLDTLNEVFRLGFAPDGLEGRYRGRLITSTLFGPLDTYSRFMEKLYMPWLGKRFERASASGDNVFRPGMKVWGRLFWPLYDTYKPFRDGLLTGFRFRTSIGAGALDPDTQVLQLDYNLPENPRFIVRDVLDELVQITGNYYLGKAYIRRPGGHYRLAAYFALQKEQ